jgi:hypothetical protein
MNEKIVMKKIISLTLAFSFLVMSITGIMLYIVPKGKVAYWANWEMFGLTKSQYGNIHITSMILFLVVTIWHIYYNWKPLISYLKNKAKQITLFKKELLIALTLNLLFVGGTLMGIQPFKSVLDINEGIKTYWEEQYGNPPYGHAEESSLQSFSQRIGVNIQKSLELLKDKSIVVENKSQTLLQIAEQNDISPKDIHDAIKPRGGKDTTEKATTDTEISSLGRRTLQELADMDKINLKKSLLFLQNEGFDATPQSRMREAANTLGITPYELFDKLKTLQ